MDNGAEQCFTGLIWEVRTDDGAVDNFFLLFETQACKLEQKFRKEELAEAYRDCRF